MKIEEIRINDYVRVKNFFQYSGLYLKVTNIVNGNVNAVFDCNGNITFSGIPIEEIEGITITTDILSKIGFVEKGYWWFDIDKRNTIQFYTFENRFTRLYEKKNGQYETCSQTTCYFLHELQHALFRCGVKVTNLDSFFLDKNKVLEE